MLSDVLSRPTLAVMLLFGLASPSMAQPGAASARTGAATSQPQILAVMGAFRRAIMVKDEPGFLALFMPGPVVWQSVDSDATRAAKGIADRDPVFRDPDKTPQSFIRNIVMNPSSIDESMSNITIQSDGEIAAVAFNFVCSRDGQPTNCGLEAWHLLRTGGGWRIISVVWSNRPPAKSAIGGCA